MDERPRAIHASAVERYYSPEEIAELLNVSTDTVLRRFSSEQGVVDLGSPEKMHKRRYRVLRIPESVLVRYLAKRRVA